MSRENVNTPIKYFQKCYFSHFVNKILFMKKQSLRQHCIITHSTDVLESYKN